MQLCVYFSLAAGTASIQCGMPHPSDLVAEHREYSKTCAGELSAARASTGSTISSSARNHSPRHCAPAASQLTGRAGGGGALNIRQDSGIPCTPPRNAEPPRLLDGSLQTTRIHARTAAQRKQRCITPGAATQRQRRDFLPGLWAFRCLATQCCGHSSPESSGSRLVHLRRIFGCEP